MKRLGVRPFNYMRHWLARTITQSSRNNCRAKISHGYIIDNGPVVLLEARDLETLQPVALDDVSDERLHDRAFRLPKAVVDLPVDVVGHGAHPFTTPVVPSRWG